MQFDAQRHHYREHHPGASVDVVLVAGQPAGRLSVARSDSELRIVDLALLPRFRGRGVGTRLLQDLLGEAAEAGTPVSIHVERSNPAMSLYRRLGFTPVADRGVHILMERRAVT